MKGILVLTALAAAVLVAVAAWSDDSIPAGPNGKDVFLKYRCNSCHTIKAQGVEKKAAAEEAGEKSDSDKQPPDLSDVGKKVKADWIAKFLLKQEKLDGELHRKKFRGTDAELKTVATWLEAQKADAKAAKKGK